MKLCLCPKCNSKFIAANDKNKDINILCPLCEKEKKNNQIKYRKSLEKKGIKKCSKCGKLKPFEEFYKTYLIQIGYTSACKKCIAAAKGVKKNKERFSHLLTN